MDIFERNQPRRLALAEAIKKAEYALHETEEYYRLQILKQQQKMLPNNQGYTMSDISWERAKQLGKEELAAHRARIDALNTGKLFVLLIYQITAMPLLVIEQINKIYQNRDFHNSLLYKNILKMFKKYPNIKFKGYAEYRKIPNILSQYNIALMPYSEKVYVLSVCNKHDTWLNFINI